MKRRHGFTIVELMVVIAAIAILMAITSTAYGAYQKRSYDGQIKSLAAAVKSGAERYYNTNNEYPLASQLSAPSSPGVNPPSSYATASTLLNVPTTNLNSSRIKLVPCAGSCPLTSTTNRNYVYYLTKAASDGTASRQYTNGGCTYTFPTSEDGALSFVIAFYYSEGGYWKATRSDKGNVTSSDPYGWCPFTPL